MTLYKFHTFRTDYYFPAPVKGGAFLFGLYHPYNQSKLRLLAIHIYWWLFKNCSTLRNNYRVLNPDNEFPCSIIMSLCPKDSIMSFNLGTPGNEQKISMLGLAPNGAHFFAKFSTLPDAMELSRNEIKILKKMHGKNIAPELLDYKNTSEYVYFRTTCVDGENPTTTSLNNDVLNLAIKINSINITNGSLKTSLSHGDFTPWNIIVTNHGEYKLIDWEMADNREIGYDLFTYVLHVGTLLNPNEPFTVIINKNARLLNQYFSTFDIADWSPYLRAFALRRIEYERSKGDLDKANNYKCLL